MSQNFMAGRVSPHSTASPVFNEKNVTLCDWFPCFVLNCVYQGCQNSRPAGLFRPATSFYVARESIWLSYKEKTYATLYHTLWSAYQYHKFLFLFAVLFIRRNWLAYDTQWFFHWWWLRGRLQRNKADLIKCSSTIDGKTRCSPFI